MSRQEPDDPMGSSSLDTALLESLFYNEMMQIEDSSSLLATGLFSSLSSDLATTTTTTTGPPPSSTSVPLSQIDPSTIAEKALLRHFGVSAETPAPVSTEVPPQQPPPMLDTPSSTAYPPLDPGVSMSMHKPPPSPWCASEPNVTGLSHGELVNSGKQVPAGPFPTTPQDISIHDTQVHAPTPSFPACAVSAVESSSSAAMITVQPSSSQLISTIGPALATKTSAPASFLSHPEPEERQHRKLVSQFATLASRLRIRVPSHLLESLLHGSDDHHHEACNVGRGSEKNAASNDAAATYASAEASAAAVRFAPLPPVSSVSENVKAAAGVMAPWDRGTTTELPFMTLSDPSAATDLRPAPAAVRELESVAKAAIAAVSETTRKRPSFDSETAASENSAASAADATAGTLSNIGSAPGAASAGKAPAYSKRRKKPRLADCESKLAQLQAENELLKRHLTTISNQNHKIDAERKDLEKKMRTMLETGATPREMDQLVQTFSDYYSDYGRRRHQELEFHLEQLQRLANPTNVTKMGLWTLGQQSSNPRKDPIAGILQRELGITPQQGKKILEQRQKIRDVCTNLSECLTLLSKLKGLCEQKTKIFNDRMEKCREILSPRQVIKLLIWIDEHSAVLEKVCPGWGSEQIPTKPKKG